ncbi:hypothetical protein EE612_048530, partial [Oryza sativa]
ATTAPSSHLRAALPRGERGGKQAWVPHMASRFWLANFG